MIIERESLIFYYRIHRFHRLHRLIKKTSVLSVDKNKISNISVKGDLRVKFDANEYQDRITQAVDFLRKNLKQIPQIIITAGSGLGRIVEILNKKGKIEIPFEEIPFHPKATVEGHSGNLIVGISQGKRVGILCGRIHFYEGHPPENVIFLIRVLIQLGVKNFIFTNAAGGLNINFKPGSFMIIKDHYNFTFRNPLVGSHKKIWGERFPDLSNPYDPELIKIATKSAINKKIEVHQGVYIACLGPSYETRKEVEMLRLMGDAVGMSTVPETLAVRQAGRRVLGISIITNSLVLGGGKKVTHKEVLETSKKVESKIVLWLKDIIRLIK